ncbi:hypothetical protein MKX03_007435, partial [Papaver bracteatum]
MRNFIRVSQISLENCVTYLGLDGSVEPEKRFEIVKAFNSDPTIDVLLLTTHVGGLGLNLTAADTLVFMEHDWNPMRDHQAMDRAHRLGQHRVVNVHRLIMRGTLEEKVMSLQRFKVFVANAVINAENTSMKTMNTDQLLDLFTPAQPGKKENLNRCYPVAKSLQTDEAVEMDDAAASLVRLQVQADQDMNTRISQQTLDGLIAQ